MEKTSRSQFEQIRFSGALENAKNAIIVVKMTLAASEHFSQIYKNTE